MNTILIVVQLSIINSTHSMNKSFPPILTWGHGYGFLDRREGRGRDKETLIDCLPICSDLE